MGLHRGALNAFCKIVGKSDAERLAKKTPFEKVEKVYNIPYADDGNKYHLLDLYFPEGNDKKLPVIIDIHGGAWIYGTKEINAHYCQGLASNGFVVVNINYRLIKEKDDGTFPHNLQDIFLAFNWVEKHIAEYNGDLNNVFLTGDSAGAHLSAMAQSVMLDSELSKKLEVSSGLKFNAIAFTCGVFDMEVFERIKLPIMGYMFGQFFGKDYKNNAFKKVATIKNNKLEQFPPIFLNTCYGDFVKKQVFSFYEECKKRNVNVEIKIIDKKRTNKLIHVYSVLFPEFEESIETTQALISFFNKYKV